MTAGRSRRAIGDQALPAWLRAVEDRLDDLASIVGRASVFADVTARNAAIPNPRAGRRVMVGTSQHLHDGTGWLAYDTDWTAYTPTLTNMTLGNGTLTAAYLRMGRLARLRFEFEFGSTSSVTGTDWRFTVPSGMDVATWTQIAHVVQHQWLIHFFDNGGSSRIGLCRSETATTIRLLRLDASTADVAGFTPSTTTPFTWGSADGMTTDNIVYPMSSPYVA